MMQNDGLNNGMRPTDVTGRNLFGNLGIFFAVQFGSRGSLCLTCYLGSILKKNTKAGELLFARVLRSKNVKKKKTRPFV